MTVPAKDAEVAFGGTKSLCFVRVVLTTRIQQKEGWGQTIARDGIRGTLMTDWVAGNFRYRNCPMQFNERGVGDIGTRRIILGAAA